MSKQIPVGEISTYKKGYAFKSKDYAPEGIPIVKVSDFDNHIVSKSSTKLKYEVSDGFEDWKLKKNDILIATVGSWATNPNSIVGKVVKVNDSLTDALLNQNCVRLRAQEGFDQKFLFYSLKTKNFANHCISSAQGSANQASITLNDIHDFMVPNFSLAEQQKISNFFSNIDDKIELNQKMNETLEEIAKTLFKSWFIDFDPVRAKAEGRPTGLSKEISDLFPDDFEDSELGEIPRGWSKSIITDIANKISEKYKKDEDWSNEKLIDLSRMPSNSISLTSHGRGDELSTSVCKFKKYDFLFGSIRPYFYKAGICPYDGVSNTSVFILRAKKSYDKEFMYFYSSNDVTFERSVQYSDGTKMPVIKWDDYKEFPFALPNEDLRKQFSSIINPVVDKIILNIHEQKVLSEVRDTLLPRLISGELLISDAENLIKEAGV